MTDRAAGRTVAVTGVESGGLGGLSAALADGTRLDVRTVDADDLLAKLDGADALVVGDNPPASDGIGTFHRVRAAEWHLPVLLVGGTVDPDRVETALSAGVTEYLAAWSDDRGAELAARIRAHVTTPALDGMVQADRWQTIAESLIHDIKNPLNVAAGRLELLNAEDEHSEAIERSIGRVESLLDELSAVAGVAGPIESVEPVDLADMAGKVWRDVGGSADRLTVEAAGTVRADPDCLWLILERFFENALVHAGADAAVTVGSTEMGFYIADDGPGVPAADRERVFEQGYGTAREGEGYGLFVVESVATAHGWDVLAGESEAGGARFEVRAR